MQAMSRRVETILLLLILLLAGGLRLGWPGLTEFKGDEARLMLLALDMVEGKQFPVRGIGSSVGLPNTPMSVWLYALPLFLWKHIYAATLFTGLLNTLAVLGCWWLVRRYWGAEAGLAAALFFAVSPWALFHSRKIWAQNLLPFFTVGWGISGLLTFVEGKSRWLVVHLLCLATAAQVHFAGVALAPATVLYLVWFRGRVRWQWFGLGLLLAGLTALPFLIYLAQQGISLEQFLQPTGENTRRWDVQAWHYAWWLITGQDFYTLVGGSAWADYRSSVPQMGLLYGVIMLLCVGGIVLWRRQPNMPPDLQQPKHGLLFFVLIWLFSPILLFSLPFLPIVHHYLLPFYPLPFAAMGVGMVWLARRIGRVAWLALLLVGVGQLWSWGGVLRIMANQATPGGLGTPVAYYVAAANSAHAWWEQRPTGEIIIGGGGESTDQDEFAAIFAVLLRDVPHRFVDAQAHALFPAQPALTLLTPAAAPPIHSLYQDTTALYYTIPLRPGEGEISLWELSATPAPSVPLNPPSLFANWVQLTGYTPLTLSNEQKAVWALHWQTGNNPDPTDYHFFNHLYDAAGLRVAQQDGALFAPGQWRAGDQVVSLFTFDITPDWPRPLMMSVGIYTYPDITNIPLLDVAGNPYAVAVDLPAE